MKNLEKLDLEQLKEKLNGLATAREAPICYVEKDAQGALEPHDAPDFKAIINNKTGAIETIASKNYAIIQHKDAFDAVLDAVAICKQDADVRANVLEQNGRAWMTVVFADAVAEDGANGIALGFKVTNSYDKTSALKYSGSNKDNTEGRFEFFGLRLACMNGMTMKISLGTELPKIEAIDRATAKVGDIVKVDKDPEFVVPVHQVSSYIRHVGNAQVKVEQVRNMLLALPTVAKQLEAKIKAVQNISFTQEEAQKRLEELGFGVRLQAQILQGYQQEEQTAWGLYNAITAYASHNEKVSPLATERNLKRAEMLLEARA